MDLSPDEISKVTDEFRLDGSLKELFQTKLYRRNLFLLIIIWSFCTFSFYLVPYYLDTLPGNLFLLSSSTAMAEIIASFISLAIANKFETRKSVALFAFISCFSTIGIILLSSLYKGTSQIPDAVGYLIQYTGFVTTFNMVYVIVNELFPTLYVATAYGACNIIGRAVAVSSPLVARVNPPWPMLILAVYSLICAVLAMCLVRTRTTVSPK